MFTIGDISISNSVVAAPMAGVSDRPYRSLARKMGAGLAVSEMLTSKPELHKTSKTQFRMNIASEQAPVSIQLVGTEPDQLADAARFNEKNGADIIDINMGCPAKKVCKKLAGSALLENEKLVEQILQAVVNAVDVPVTLKIRTGITPKAKNAVTIAKIAEASGVQALTIHGRTRQCRFKGNAEYQTIAKVKQSVAIPIIANGDIQTPIKALEVLNETGADAVMIGRAAQGQPWLFHQIAEFISHGRIVQEPSFKQKTQIILDHVRAIHDFYGENLGVKFARKHIAWYFNYLDSNKLVDRSVINQQQTQSNQLQHLQFALEKIELFQKTQLPKV